MIERSSPCLLVSCLALLVVVRPIDMAHELGARARVAAERAAHGRGDHLGVGLLDAAHHRAHVYALGHHRYAARLERRVDEIGDLHRQALLHLWRTGVPVHQPCELRQSDESVTRQVSDIGDPVERQEVMAADGG